MQAADGRFRVLDAFRQQAEAAHSREEVAALVAAFGRQQLQATTSALLATAEAPTTPGHAVALGQSGYWWHLSRQTPLAHDDQALHHLAAAVLNLAPFFQERRRQSEERLDQLQLMHNIASIARLQRPLEETLAEAFRLIGAAVGFESGFIGVHEPAAHRIALPVVVSQGRAITHEPLSSLDDKSMAAWVLVNNKEYVTGDWENDDRPAPGRAFTEEPVRSVVALPLRAEQEIVGVLSAQSGHTNAFDAVDYRLLRAVAEQLGLVVQQARLFATTRALVDKGVRDYQTAVILRQAIAVISASLEPKVILQNLLLALGDVFPYDLAYVFVRRDDQFEYATGHDYHDQPLPVSPDEATSFWRHNRLVAQVAQRREPVVLQRQQADDWWPQMPDTDHIQTWMGIPLVISGDVVGVLLINSHRPAAFQRHEQWLASTLCAQAAVALQNATLHRRTHQQLQELSTLYQASAMMTANLDQDFVLQTVVSEMVRAVQVDSCSIFVWDEAHQALQLAAHENQFAPTPEDRTPAYARVGLRNIAQLQEYPIVQRVFETQEIHSLRHDNAHSPHQVALLEAAGLNSVLLVPLARRQQVLGLMALGQVAEPRTFTPSELRLTQNLAGQATVAIEHANLFSQVQRRVQELSTFHEITLQLNTSLGLKGVLDSITTAALKLVDANNMHIFLYDAATSQFTFGSALWRDGRRRPAVSVPRSNGITMEVVRQASPIVINDASAHALFGSAESAAWGICAIAGFPLKHDDQVMGVFTTTYLHPHVFTEDELLLLNLLADQAAVAVRNARLHDETQRRLRAMAALVDMAKQVTSSLNLTSVLQTTVQILRQLLSARASTITMLSKEGTELVVEAAAGISPEYVKARMKLSEGVSGEVVRRAAPVYIRDTYSEPDFLFFDEVVRSLLVVPLIIRDKARGTLTIDSDRPHAFTDTDMQLLTVAAAQVAIAISNARLFEELEDRAAELAQAYDELKESDRLKDELVQNVSHELRTPLTFVKGYVDLLMDGEMGLMNQAQQDALQIVSNKTDEITRLIDDIMTLQRIDAGNLQLEELALGDLIEQSVAGHKMVAEKSGLQVNCHIEENHAVFGDRGRIIQVLDNLISNAIKFSPEGGLIRVRLTHRDGEALVQVTDQGIGIPPEKMERIFERFYQVDGSSRRRFGGTGLGLAIAKRIVDAHGGEIWVESESNLGSSFFFTLPKKSVL